MRIKRYVLSNCGVAGNFGLEMSENPRGEWIKFEDLKKLIIKLTQGREWNDMSIKPIKGKECFIMLLDGEIKPAVMSNETWVKPTGYLHPFDVDKSDVIKWRYDQPHH